MSRQPKGDTDHDHHNLSVEPKIASILQAVCPWHVRPVAEIPEDDGVLHKIDAPDCHWSFTSWLAGQLEGFFFLGRCDGELEEIARVAVIEYARSSN